MRSIKEKVLNGLIITSKQRLIVPFYHKVTDAEQTFTKYLYVPRKINNFKEDLEVLSKYYKPITLKEFSTLSISKKKQAHNYFHLTFDDGLSNFYEIVAPILLKKKIPATIFINTDFVDNKALFYRYKASLLYQVFEKSSLKRKSIFYDFFEPKKDIKEQIFAINYNNKNILDNLAKEVNYDFDEFLKEEKPYLTTAQIKELIDMGFTIGAHSKNHPLYANINFEEQVCQTKESMNWLIKKFDLEYKVFSFPHTDLQVSRGFFVKMAQENIVDFSFGTSGIKKDDFETNFQRMVFEIGKQKATDYLLKEYLKYFLKIPFKKHIMPRN